MRTPRVCLGMRPYTRAERKRPELQHAEFPDIVRQRLLATCDALERAPPGVASLRSAKLPPPPQPRSTDA